MSRICLVPLCIEDVDLVMTWVNDPEVVKNFQNFGHIVTREEELRYIEKIVASPNDKTFSVWANDGKDYIGQTAINQISFENRLGRLSLMIKRSEWNKGYAGEIVPIVLSYAFDCYQLNKVWLMCYAENEKGRHLWKKLGFKEEGCLRGEYWWNGRYHDIVRMGMLDVEYCTLYKG